MKKTFSLILILAMLLSLACPAAAFAASLGKDDMSANFVYDTRMSIESVQVAEGLDAYLRLPGFLGVLEDQTIETTQGKTNSDVYVVYADDDSWDGDSYYGALSIRMTVKSGYSITQLTGTNQTLAWKCMYDSTFQPVDGGSVVFSGSQAELNFSKGPGLYLGIGVIPFSYEDLGTTDYTNAASSAETSGKIQMAAVGYNFILVLNDKMIDHYMANGTLESTSTFTWPGLKELIESKRTKADSKLLNFVQKYIYYSGVFKDVGPANPQWYDSYVSKVYELGFMKGSTDQNFNPESNISLAECLAIAARMHSIYNGGGGSFTQDPSDWSKVYLDYCTANGIVTAKDFTDLSKPANRAQMAYIFANALDAEGLEAVSPDIEFEDVSSATAYDDEILVLARAGIVQGDDRGYRPLDNIKRSEAAAIVARMADISLRLK